MGVCLVRGVEGVLVLIGCGEGEFAGNAFLWMKEWDTGVRDDEISTVPSCEGTQGGNREMHA